MSELKAINAYQLTTNTEDSDVYIHNDEFGCGGDLVECYLKSEADVVIAEKDKEIAELKKSLEQKKIAEGSVCRILWNLVDSGIIKEWYFNGEYNVLLSVDDPHIQIAELKTKIDKVSLKFCKQIRHNKYKRCLAMASKCRLRARWFCDNAFYKKEQWVLQWHKRWLKLAEKFKPNNLTPRRNDG